MDQNDIATLFRYNDWANARVLRQAALLAPEQYTAPAPTPQGSLRGTLVHTLAAEVAWRRRWQGQSPTALLSQADLPTFADLRDRSSTCNRPCSTPPPRASPERTCSGR